MDHFSVLRIIVSLIALCVTIGHAIHQTAVEGITSHVDYLCNLDQQSHPLYWKIREKIFDLYSLPGIFTVLGHEAIRLNVVDRRMDGWTFQCFTIDHTNGRVLNAGQKITLTVIYAITEELRNTEQNILESFQHGGPVLHYQEVDVKANISILNWFDFTPSCAVAEYRVDIFPHGEIANADSQRDMQDMETLGNYTTQTMNTAIPSHSLKDDANKTNYVQIITVDANSNECSKSVHFYGLFGSSVNDIRMTRNSTASFEIPHTLSTNRSVQLIWSKDDHTQCVCPPVEPFLSQCACNADNPNSNVISMSGNTMTISNLTQEPYVTLHFVSSVSGACNGFCNLRSIVEVYNITMLAVDAPETLQISHSNTSDTICFTVPDSSFQYEVNLTDITGALTRLSGVYNTSHCLNVTSDLYPDVCGPFLLSVADAEGRITELTVAPNTSTSEQSLCNCYRKKGMMITSTTTPTSADLTLHCQNSLDRNSINALNVTIRVQTPNTATTLPQVITISCNSTRTVHSLLPSTHYSIEMDHAYEQTCLLHSLKTDTAYTSTTVSISIIISCTLVVLLLCLVFCGLCCFLRYFHRKYSREYYVSQVKNTIP